MSVSVSVWIRLESWYEISGGSVEDLILPVHGEGTRSTVEALVSKCPCPNKADGIQPKVWPQFSCWKSMTDSASGEADTLHSSYMLSWQSYCGLLPGVFVLLCLNFPWVFNIIGFKNPLAVQTLMHLYEFTHLDVCTVTDGKTTVDVILHVVRLARQSLRCAKVVPDKKWRWAVLLPQSIGKFDANDTTEAAL